MKTKIILIIALLCAFAGTAWADADGTCGAAGNESNVTWTYVESTHTLTISGTGAMQDWHWVNTLPEAKPWDAYKAEITTLVIGDGVTNIGDFSFYGHTSLASVTIGAGVTSIGEDAFYGCSALEAITIPDGVTFINDAAFMNCSGLETVNGANGLTSAGGYVFCDTPWEEALNSTEVNYLGKVALLAKSGVSGPVSIADGTVGIAGNAFSDSYITSVTIPASVTNIGMCAFGHCANLATVTFADGSQLTTIGEYAFDSCPELTSISIPASVTTIGEYAFQCCTDLATVTFADGSQLTSIGESAFDSCSELTSITIPASVTTIGKYAFQYCTNLATVTFADGSQLTSIDNHAFLECGNLKAITLPASVTTIGGWAFYECWNLATVTVYAPSCTLGEYVFDYCDDYLIIIVPAAAYNSYYNAECWNSYQSRLKKNIATCTATVPNQTLEGPNSPFDNINYKFEYANNNYSESYAQEFIAGMDVVVKDGETVLSLGTDYLFGNVTYANGDPITDSEIGDECKVEIVGQGQFGGSQWASFKVIAPDASDIWGDSDILTWAFHDGTLTITGSGEMKAAAHNSDYPWYSSARYINTITIGEGVTTVAAAAFGGTAQLNSYSSLTTVSLPSTLTSIGEDAFAYSGITTLNIPASVTTIGLRAFNQCSSLTSVTLNGGATVGDAAFPTNANTTVTIVDGLTLNNGEEDLSGDVTDMSKLNGKTLQPVATGEDASKALIAKEETFAGQTRYWTTFYHPTWTYELPAGAQAFILKSTTDMTLYRVGDGSIIPADCAVVIMADASALTGISAGAGTLTLTATTAAAPSVSGNVLQGTPAETAAPSGAYVLSKVGTDFGFFTVTGNIPVNKAYFVE